MISFFYEKYCVLCPLSILNHIPDSGPLTILGPMSILVICQYCDLYPPRVLSQYWVLCQFLVIVSCVHIGSYSNFRSNVHIVPCVHIRSYVCFGSHASFWSYVRITLFPHCGTRRTSSHLTLDFVVPCPLSLPSHQTKDIFGQTRAGRRSSISSVTHLCSLTNMYHGTPP